MEEKQYTKKSIEKSHKTMEEWIGNPQKDFESMNNTMGHAFTELSKALQVFGRSIANLPEIQFMAKRLKYLNKRIKKRK